MTQQVSATIELLLWTTQLVLFSLIKRNLSELRLQVREV
jgi:hypothetical protein